MLPSAEPAGQPPAYILYGASAVGRGRELVRAPVLVEKGRIAGVGRAAETRARRLKAPAVALEGGYLVPGFLDLHTHGARGVDFATASEDDIEGTFRHYLSHGVTGLLASLYPQPRKDALATLERLSRFLEEGRGRGLLLGIHLEGPFLSAKKPGALPIRNFRRPSRKALDELLAAGRGWVRTMTLAPELPGARGLVRDLRRRNVIPAFGHSDADYTRTRAALGWGIRYATHLFNAMNGLHHRAPGAVAALLEDPETFVEVISDGHHIHPPVLGLIHRLKRRERIILVSDSVLVCGLRDGTYRFAGGEVTLRRGRVTLPGGTLAGSALTLDEAVRLQVRRIGVPLADAVRFASANPAALLGLERERGTIARGRRADLVHLDERLRVQATWLGGTLAWTRSRALKRRIADLARARS